MLNMWRLKLLVQFQTLGTMQQVSEVMHTSIATVSQQLSLLEQETDKKLFEKVGRKLQLTHEGLDLVAKVRPVINQLEEIESTLKDTSYEVQGTVRIASFTSALDNIVIPRIAKLSTQHPKIQVHLSEVEPDESIPALDAFQYDLAVVAYAEKHHQLTQSHRKVIKLGSDKLKLLVSNEHPLAKQDYVYIEDLKEQQWILEPDETYLSDYTRKLCHEAGFEPNVINRVQSYQSMHAMISANLGVGLLPELAIIKPTKGIRVLDLQVDATRDIYLVARGNTTTTRAMKIVTNILTESEEKG